MTDWNYLRMHRWTAERQRGELLGAHKLIQLAGRSGRGRPIEDHTARQLRPAGPCPIINGSITQVKYGNIYSGNFRAIVLIASCEEFHPQIVQIG